MKTTAATVKILTISFCSMLMRPRTASSMKLTLLERKLAYSEREVTSRLRGRSLMYSVELVSSKASSLLAYVSRRRRLTRQSRWRVSRSPTRPRSWSVRRRALETGTRLLVLPSGSSLRKMFLERRSSSAPKRSSTSAWRSTMVSSRPVKTWSRLICFWRRSWWEKTRKE